MVGRSGHVNAFEPDDEARSFRRNDLACNDVENLTVLDSVIGERSSYALFSMDGTQAAGLTDSLVYVRDGKRRRVQVSTSEDACVAAGIVPNLIKCYIEGAELRMVRGSFETHRLRDGSFAHEHLKPILTPVGYIVEHAVSGAGGPDLFYATPW